MSRTPPSGHIKQLERRRDILAARLPNYHGGDRSSYTRMELAALVWALPLLYERRDERALTISDVELLIEGLRMIGQSPERDRLREKLKIAAGDGGLLVRSDA